MPEVDGGRARHAGTPEADRMIVSGSSEVQSAAVPAGSPGQACSSTNDPAEPQQGRPLLSQGLLSCSCCGQLLLHGEHTPRLLPSCLHTVCGSCARQPGSDKDIQCRLCMTTSPAVEDHPLAEELLQQVHEQRRSRLCGQCGERGNQAIAVGGCAECSTELCQVCINAHQLTKLTWDHSITAYDDDSVQDICSVHHKVYDNYCDSCEEVGCGDCILSSHRAHKSCTLESKEAEVKTLLQSRLGGLRKLRVSLEAQKTQLQRRIGEAKSEKQAGINRITMMYKEHQKEVQAFFSRQLEAAQKHYDEYSGELECRLSSAELVALRLAHLDSFSEQLLEKARPPTVIGSAKYILNLVKRLKNVNLTPEKERKLPEIHMKRFESMDRVGDSLSCLLYDGDRCLQGTLMDTLRATLVNLAVPVMREQLRSGSELGLQLMNAVFWEVAHWPSGTMLPGMYDRVQWLHGMVQQQQLQRGQLPQQQHQLQHPQQPGQLPRQQHQQQLLQQPGQLQQQQQPGQLPQRQLTGQQLRNLEQLTQQQMPRLTRMLSQQQQQHMSRPAAPAVTPFPSPSPHNPAAASGHRLPPPAYRASVQHPEQMMQHQHPEQAAPAVTPFPSPSPHNPATASGHRPPPPAYRASVQHPEQMMQHQHSEQMVQNQQYPEQMMQYQQHSGQMMQHQEPHISQHQFQQQQGYMHQQQHSISQHMLQRQLQQEQTQGQGTQSHSMQQPQQQQYPQGVSRQPLTQFQPQPPQCSPFVAAPNSSPGQRPSSAWAPQSTAAPQQRANPGPPSLTGDPAVSRSSGRVSQTQRQSSQPDPLEEPSQSQQPSRASQTSPTRRTAPSSQTHSLTSTAAPQQPPLSGRRGGQARPHDQRLSQSTQQSQPAQPAQPAQPDQSAQPAQPTQPAERQPEPTSRLRRREQQGHRPAPEAAAEPPPTTEVANRSPPRAPPEFSLQKHLRVPIGRKRLLQEDEDGSVQGPMSGSLAAASDGSSEVPSKSPRGLDDPSRCAGRPELKKATSVEAEQSMESGPEDHVSSSMPSLVISETFSLNGGSAELVDEQPDEHEQQLASAVDAFYRQRQLRRRSSVMSATARSSPGAEEMSPGKVTTPSPNPSTASASEDSQGSLDMPSIQLDNPEKPISSQPITFRAVANDVVEGNEDDGFSVSKATKPMVIIHDQPGATSPKKSGHHHRRTLDSLPETRKRGNGMKMDERRGGKRRNSPVDRESSRKRCKSGGKSADSRAIRAHTKPQREQSGSAVAAYRQPRPPPSQKENQWQRKTHLNTGSDQSAKLTTESKSASSEPRAAGDTSALGPRRSRGRPRALHSEMMTPQRPADTRPNRFMLNRPSGGHPAGAPPPARRRQESCPETGPNPSPQDPLRLRFRGLPTGRGGSRGRKKWTVTPVTGPRGGAGEEASPPSEDAASLPGTPPSAGEGESGVETTAAGPEPSPTHDQTETSELTTDQLILRNCAPKSHSSRGNSSEDHSVIEDDLFEIELCVEEPEEEDARPPAARPTGASPSPSAASNPLPTATGTHSPLEINNNAHSPASDVTSPRTSPESEPRPAAAAAEEASTTAFTEEAGKTATVAKDTDKDMTDKYVSKTTEKTATVAKGTDTNSAVSKSIERTEAVTKEKDKNAADSKRTEKPAAVTKNTDKNSAVSERTEKTATVSKETDKNAAVSKMAEKTAAVSKSKERTMAVTKETVKNAAGSKRTEKTTAVTTEIESTGVVRKETGKTSPVSKASETTSVTNKPEETARANKETDISVTKASKTTSIAKESENIGVTNKETNIPVAGVSKTTNVARQAEKTGLVHKETNVSVAEASKTTGVAQTTEKTGDNTEKENALHKEERNATTATEKAETKKTSPDPKKAVVENPRAVGENRKTEKIPAGKETQKNNDASDKSDAVLAETIAKGVDKARTVVETAKTGMNGEIANETEKANVSKDAGKIPTSTKDDRAVPAAMEVDQTVAVPFEKDHAANPNDKEDSASSAGQGPAPTVPTEGASETVRGSGNSSTNEKPPAVAPAPAQAASGGEPAVEARRRSAAVQFCVLCWGDGELLACEACGRAFHRRCYVGPLGDQSSGRWQCSLCGPLPALPAAAQQSALSQKEMAAACRLLSELYSAAQPAIYFKSLESLAMKRSVEHKSFSRGWLKSILAGAKPLVEKGMSKQNAFYSSVLAICQRYKTLPQFAEIERPSGLDQIRERLLDNGFTRFADFLYALKNMIAQNPNFQKEPPLHKCLKRPETVLEELLARLAPEGPALLERLSTL